VRDSIQKKIRSVVPFGGELRRRPC